jgi:Uma2 family endonuclease
MGLMSVAPYPEWVIPPVGGFVAEDLDRFPDLPPHTELIDGSLVFVSPQASFHMRVLRVLETALWACVPAHLAVQREMSVKLARRQRPEPDIMVTLASADSGMNQTTFQAGDAVLVVEVVSEESQERDRKRKPSLYAEAGIVHFWRIEQVDGRAVVYVYELDPASGLYALTGIHHDRLRLSAPFSLDIDLTAIERRPGSEPPSTGAAQL